MAEPSFGKYRLQKLLASGGMGEVFLARQQGPQGFSKPVVIKRILKHLARDRSFLDMFVNEARLAALLTHPNITQIFELGQADGSYFIAMEFIHGRTLRAVGSQLKLRALPFPPGFAARITACVLHGLHYAHTLKGERGEPLGIIHRDVSPDNVMVGFDGSVKLLDFGIAKASNLIDTTLAGVVKGKCAYMSPEQLEAETIDARSDVWAAGVLLYETLAGRRPFPAEEDGVLVRQITTQQPAPLAELVPAAAGLAPIVHRALEKNPAKRFPSAQAMAAALERYCVGERISLTDAETGGFMKQLFAEEADQPMKTPSKEAVSGPSGIYLSQMNEIAGQTMVTSMFTAVRNMRRRALVVGVVAALMLVGVGWALSKLGARRPLAAPKPADPIAALPVAPVKPTAEFDPSAPLPGETATDAQPEPAPPPAEPAEGAPPAARIAARGKLDLRVLPWAEVFEGRKSYGITPMPPLELSAGRHTLTLRNKELSVSRKVKVKVPREGTVTLRIDLRR